MSCACGASIEQLSWSTAVGCYRSKRVVSIAKGTSRIRYGTSSRISQWSTVNCMPQNIYNSYGYETLKSFQLYNVHCKRQSLVNPAAPTRIATLNYLFESKQHRVFKFHFLRNVMFPANVLTKDNAKFPTQFLKLYSHVNGPRPCKSPLQGPVLAGHLFRP